MKTERILAHAHPAISFPLIAIAGGLVALFLASQIGCASERRVTYTQNPDVQTTVDDSEEASRIGLAPTLDAPGPIPLGEVGAVEAEEPYDDAYDTPVGVQPSQEITEYNDAPAGSDVYAYGGDTYNPNAVTVSRYYYDDPGTYYYDDAPLTDLYGDPIVYDLYGYYGGYDAPYYSYYDPYYAPSLYRYYRPYRHVRPYVHFGWRPFRARPFLSIGITFGHHDSYYHYRDPWYYGPSYYDPWYYAGHWGYGGSSYWRGYRHGYYDGYYDSWWRSPHNYGYYGGYDWFDRYDNRRRHRGRPGGVTDNDGDRSRVRGIPGLTSAERTSRSAQLGQRPGLGREIIGGRSDNRRTAATRTRADRVNRSVEPSPRADRGRTSRVGWSEDGNDRGRRTATPSQDRRTRSTRPARSSRTGARQGRDTQTPSRSTRPSRTRENGSSRGRATPSRSTRPRTSPQRSSPSQSRSRPQRSRSRSTPQRSTTRSAPNRSSTRSAPNRSSSRSTRSRSSTRSSGSRSSTRSAPSRSSTRTAPSRSSTRSTPSRSSTRSSGSRSSTRSSSGRSSSRSSGSRSRGSSRRGGGGR